MSRSAKVVPVLMYHHVSTSPGMITVSPAHFAEQMAWLVKSGYRTIGSEQLVAWFAGEPLPKKSVMLTFDDGYLDNWVHAHPVLEKYGLTALCFLVTGWPGDGPPRAHAGTGGALPPLLDHHAGEVAIENGEADGAILRWSEIDAMRAAGTFEFHSHTHTHVRWDRVAANAQEKRESLMRDLIESRAMLQARLGEGSDHLCWPQGYYDDDYLNAAQQAGFRHLYTCETGPTYPRKDAGVVRSISRLEVRDRPASWLASRLWVHTRPAISRAYLRIKR
ncbi:polysaccharide deacetylase family protein [Burkholderia sp. Ac-20365]|uniref:polysaccharide deacetylase family protein n=1 Tax=Burkholderia sp. Ac-20365 TaxID=2703897 RepID=UPI00197C5C9C|nr:polysaccharide deacetylase family protein [Burkholderia sp. Ac-20365]MBN3761684.1 polysaccharide deacetylase family protein [Burkholderia sp. Ac-20365]